MRRARFHREGLLAMQPKAWGVEIDEQPGRADRGFEEHGDAAVVEIRGPLLSRASGFWSLFCDDYESIRARVDAAFDSSAQRVVLRIDSPGGDAAGCFELARELRALAEEHGKPLEVFIEGLGCSAAYAIAGAATPGRLCVAPTATAGSIGVFEAMVDWTAQNKAFGLNVVVVSSGEQKTDRNPDVAITEAAVARVQQHVDQFAGLFFDLVAELRGGSPKAYRDMQGGVFLGEAAVGVGLADRVATWSEVIAGVSGSQEEPMGAKASKYDEAIGALKRAAEGDDEEAKKAKKALKAIEDGDKPADDKEPEGKAGDGDGDEDDKAKKAKAAEDEKKKDEEAKARASAGLDVARELAEVKSKLAAREAADAKAADDRARADLFAKRPDFSEAQRKTLAGVSLEALKEAVETWPRANAAPGSSANALTPGATGGEPVRTSHTPRLSAEQEALLRRSRGEGDFGPAKATVKGTEYVMPIVTQDQARQRLAEIEKELGR